MDDSIRPGRVIRKFLEFALVQLRVDVLSELIYCIVGRLVLGDDLVNAANESFGKRAGLLDPIGDAFNRIFVVAQDGYEFVG